ncbi:hypothetical protein Rhow_007731 [Rhodococcus wratislaviensis]|uniref:Uncharacterized protein n=1 Tax=Rhodococcus wratislaviensis TaxID=44752 RepID=A0A402CIQ3_RHOWR|nr:hypothetical protein Rhow_007731 [Rhodococcus wratislaviensis]
MGRFQLVLGGWLLIGCHTSLPSRTLPSKERSLEITQFTTSANCRPQDMIPPATGHDNLGSPPCRSRLRRPPRQILGAHRITTERPP